MSAGVDDPRAPRRGLGRGAGLFTRLSGVALVVLALGEVFVLLLWQQGVYRVDFNFVAQRWSSPWWRIWDLALLWLALVHGGNGMATIIADYARRGGVRFWLTVLLGMSVLSTLALGSYVVLTFDPNIS